MRRIIWIYGRPGVGKSSTAQALAEHLEVRDVPVAILDADHMRKGPMRDLKYTDEDREENILRLREMARFLARRSNSLHVIVTAVVPTRYLRELIHHEADIWLVWQTGASQVELWPGSRWEEPDRSEWDAKLDNQSGGPNALASALVTWMDA